MSFLFCSYINNKKKFLMQITVIIHMIALLKKILISFQIYCKAYFFQVVKLKRENGVVNNLVVVAIRYNLQLIFERINDLVITTCTSIIFNSNCYKKIHSTIHLWISSNTASTSPFCKGVISSFFQTSYASWTK